MTRSMFNMPTAAPWSSKLLRSWSLSRDTTDGSWGTNPPYWSSLILKEKPSADSECLKHTRIRDSLARLRQKEVLHLLRNQAAQNLPKNTGFWANAVKTFLNHSNS